MDRLSRFALAIAVALSMGVIAPACDREDQRDVEEIGNEIEKGGKKVENEIDEADTDGKDD